MNICHVITRLILGGAQENTLLTCEGLHRRGHTVTLVTGPPRGPEGQLLSRARAGGYRVEIVDALQREIHPFRDLRAGRCLRRLLENLRPEVVHTHSSKAGIIGRKVAASLPGVKVVHTVHGLPYHRYESCLRNALYIALEKRGARRSDAIISVADAMTRQALQVGVGTPEQYTTIYSGMEVERFLRRPDDAETFRQSLELPDGAVLVTQVARLADLKGHEFLLDAAERLDDPRIVFCFVGDGALREPIARSIAFRGLQERFRLTGLLPPEQMPAVMHAGDILVHCSQREGLARTLPQAMLAARPVISWDIDGAAEVVDEQTGVLLDVGDVDGLTGAIRSLADDADARDRLGRAGRELCRHRFDHHRMVEQIEQLYRRILRA